MNWNQKQIENIRFTAVRSLFPDGQFRISAGGDVTFIDDTEPPTEEEIVAEEQRILQEWEDTKYQRDRSAAYPSIPEQLDMLYWDKVNGTEKWKEHIEMIKQNYPKGI